MTNADKCHDCTIRRGLEKEVERLGREVGQMRVRVAHLEGTLLENTLPRRKLLRALLAEAYKDLEEGQ